MEIFALDNTNVESFSPLLTEQAVEGILNGTDMQGFVVKEADRYVGALAGGFTDDGLYEITSLYVLPDYRNIGVGELMLETLYKALDGMNAEIRVTFASVNEEFEALEEFLDYQGFDEYRVSEERTYRVTLGDLANTKLKETKLKVEYPTFEDLPKKGFQEFEKKAKESDTFIPVPQGGFTSEDVDAKVSTAIVKDGSLRAYTVVERLTKKSLVLSSLFVDEREDPTTLLKLLRCTLSRLLSAYSEDTEIYLPTATEESERMITTLFEEGDPALRDVMVSYRKYVNFTEPVVDENTFVFEPEEDEEEREPVRLMNPATFGETSNLDDFDDNSDGEV